MPIEYTESGLRCPCALDLLIWTCGNFRLPLRMSGVSFDISKCSEGRVSKVPRKHEDRGNNKRIHKSIQIMGITLMSSGTNYWELIV